MATKTKKKTTTKTAESKPANYVLLKASVDLAFRQIKDLTAKVSELEKQLAEKKKASSFYV